MSTLKFLSDNSNIWFILVLASVDFNFYSSCDFLGLYLDILSITLGHSGSYLNILFYRELLRFSIWLLAYFCTAQWPFDFQCLCGVILVCLMYPVLLEFALVSVNECVGGIFSGWTARYFLAREGCGEILLLVPSSYTGFSEPGRSVSVPWR